MGKDDGLASDGRSVSSQAAGRELITNAHEWVAGQTQQNLSPLAKHVCDVLHFAGSGGIYNRPVNWDREDLTDNYCVSLDWSGGLSNWDAPHLTAIWAHCAAKMLRFEIRPASRFALRLMFWQRHTRDGAIMARLPTAADQIAFVGAACSEAEATQREGEARSQPQHPKE